MKHGAIRPEYEKSPTVLTPAAMASERPDLQRPLGVLQTQKKQRKPQKRVHACPQKGAGGEMCVPRGSKRHIKGGIVNGKILQYQG